MKIGIPLETQNGETRVAATPETVKKFIAAGHTVLVEKSAGLVAAYPDSAYEAMGADHFFQLGDDVIGQVLRHLQPSVCATCRVRVFANCQGQPGAV